MESHDLKCEYVESLKKKGEEDMKFTKYGADSRFSIGKSLKNYEMYLFKDTTGYVGKIDRFEDGELIETYFVAERKLFNRRLGGWNFVPHYNDNLVAPQKTLEKVWNTFMRQASKQGYNTLCLGQPDAH